MVLKECLTFRIEERGLASGLKYYKNLYLMVPRWWAFSPLLPISVFLLLYFRPHNRNFSLYCNVGFLLYFLSNFYFCITQVDLVTMLEKAISYVKFLQLQVKVWLEAIFTLKSKASNHWKRIYDFIFFGFRYWQQMNFGRFKVGKLLIFLK